MTTQIPYDLTNITGFTRITPDDAWMSEYVVETYDGFYWVCEEEIGRERFASFVDVVKFSLQRQEARASALVEGEELLRELAAQIAPERNGGDGVQVEVARVMAAKIEHNLELERFRALMRSFVRSEAVALVPWFERVT
ncbi:MAG: hypothetical protein KDE50_12525 [Caldilineaceae bacterium]|nr:hypothetical protein [Caldilineaceae bacterium]